MNILIKGMAMPKSCGDCPCGSIFSGFKCYIERKKFEKYPLDSRQDWCPLVPVPADGRLIDADALAHDLAYDVENDQRALDEMDFVGKERERMQFDKDCKQNCIWYLSNAPTIILASEEDE